MQTRGGRVRVSLATATAVFTLALAACAPQGANQPPVGDGQAATADAADTGSNHVATVAVPPEPAPPPPPPPEPDELVGMPPDEVESRIGEPDHIWREPPAAVWQYHRGPCVLHVFLYAKENGLSVVHYETRLRDSTEPPPATGCYPTLVEQAKGETGEG